MSDTDSAEAVAALEYNDINHRHTNNWLPCYIIVTLIPVLFIACACYSNHKAKRAKRAARTLRAANLANAHKNPHSQQGGSRTAAKEEYELREMESKRNISNHNDGDDYDDDESERIRAMTMKDLESGEGSYHNSMSATTTVVDDMAPPAPPQAWWEKGHRHNGSFAR